MADDHDNSHNAEPARANRKVNGTPRGYTESESHALLGGLTVVANGLRLDASNTRIDPGVKREWTYQVRNEEGDIVTEFEETHDQLAHLILVRRDLTRFQHLHPDLDEDGTWSAEFALPDPGVYRAFVDVLVDDQPTTLGLDLFSSGSVDYETRPTSTRRATAGEYDVVMTPETVPINENATVEFEVRHDGDVAHLDPYLGALGHLVALREGDLAYLHVHPEETVPEDGIVRFTIHFPTPGRYRLFLQAKPDGKLITVSFDVVTE